jgi:16S rRNA G966 N2-methylase RsmD
MQSILTEKAILIWQHSKREAAPALAHLAQTAQRAFGDTLLTFYRSPQTATPENP